MKTGINAALIDAEGVDNMFEDVAKQNIKLNTISLMVADILLYVFPDNPGKESLGMARRLDTIMKHPELGDHNNDNKNKPILIVIINKVNDYGGFKNPFDLFENIIKESPEEKQNIDNFRSRFRRTQSIAISRKNEPSRKHLYEQEWNVLNELLLAAINSRIKFNSKIEDPINETRIHTGNNLIKNMER